MKRRIFLFILAVLSVNVFAQTNAELIARYTFETGSAVADAVDVVSQKTEGVADGLNGGGTDPVIITNAERGGKVMSFTFGNNAEFQSTLRYARFPNPFLNQSDLTGATISLWVYRHTDITVWDGFWCFTNTTNATVGECFFLTPNACLGYNDYNGNWFDFNHGSSPTNAIPENAWAMVTVTINSSNFVIYVNGVLTYDFAAQKYVAWDSNLAESGSTRVEITNWNKLGNVINTLKTVSYFNLGWSPFWGSPSLYVDDVSLYKGALTAEEVAALYNASTHTNIAWNGTVSNNWNVPANWEPKLVPYINSDVTLPSGAANYPVLTGPAYANTIHFKPGAELGNPQRLKYFNAQVDFDLLAKERSDRYYTIGAPLKNMVVGDYSFGGSPSVYARYTTPVESEIGTDTKITSVGFTEDLPDYNVDLPRGFGFAYKVGTDRKTGSVGYNDIVTFPYFTDVKGGGATTGGGDNSDSELLAKHKPSINVNDDYAGMAAYANRTSWNLANVHDPTVEKCGDYYYMYQTDASYGNALDGQGHFFCRRSKDLVKWEWVGPAMQTIPGWVKTKLNSIRSAMNNNLSAINDPIYGYWAPVVRKVTVDGTTKYRMYYSIVIDNYIKSGAANTTDNFDNSWTERAFIGLMETTDLATNTWTDKGEMVVCSATDCPASSNNVPNGWGRSSSSNWNAYFTYNAIDPTYIVTPGGDHYLIYGSWHSGIVYLKLNPSTGLPATTLANSWGSATNLATYGTEIYSRGSSRWQASEGPEIIHRNGYYYLFLAYDELSVAYNTRVCRASSIEGPYYSFNSTNVTSGNNDIYPILTHPYKFNNHSGWVGIAHCAVFSDGNDNWFYASQGRLPKNTNGNEHSDAIMMGHVRKIRWINDWPVVMPERYTAVPDVPIGSDELAGSWEVINLAYSYQTQQTSQTITLNSNGTATGGTGYPSGAWSWDAAKKELTIGGRIYCVEREMDWEASPRKLTIIFAGLNNTGVSVWGKKVDN